MSSQARSCSCWGASPIGLLAAVAAQHAGAAQVLISDIYPTRLDTAQKLGVTATVNVRDEDLAAAVDRVTDGEGADALVDTSGNRSVLESAPGLMRRGGAIAVSVITDCLPLAATREAFDMVIHHKDRAIKVMVTP